MKSRSINLPVVTLAVIGHIDHGKSTLQGRLLSDSGQINRDRIEEMKNRGGELAFLLDSFEEEQKGEMTIDVSYSRLKTKKRSYVLVDNPGHLQFVKNMLTGASQASGVILVVSAKPGEGIQFQTKRHLRLIKLLGIKELLVVINKMDMVDYNEQKYTKLKNKIQVFLSQIGFDSGSVVCIPVSAKFGDNICTDSNNMTWYKGKTLSRLLDEVFTSPANLANKPLRAVIQGRFDFDRRQVVFVKVEYGKLKAGRSICYFPSTEKVKIEKIVKGEKTVREVVAGETSGLVVSEIPSDFSEQQIIGEPHSPLRVVRSVNADVFLFGDSSISEGEVVQCYLNSREYFVEVNKILSRTNSETGKKVSSKMLKLLPKEMGKVTLHFSQKVAIESFKKFPALGRFMLVKNSKSIAFGVVR